MWLLLIISVAYGFPQLPNLPWLPNQPNATPANIFNQSACYQETTTRGVGVVPSLCPSGMEYQAGLCYTLCKDGYSGLAAVCSSICPDDFNDNGATCSYGISIMAAKTTNCPLINPCGIGSDCGQCPVGYTRTACMCSHKMANASIIPKTTYARTPVIPSCPQPNMEISQGLCYPVCPPGQTGSGALCLIPCPATFPVLCGAMCGAPGFDCSAVQSSGISMAKQCLTGGANCLSSIKTNVKGAVMQGTCISNMTQHGCWKPSSPRLGGFPPTSCLPGSEMQGILCYPKCDPGYAANYSVCTMICPDGYTDAGPVCTYNYTVVPADVSECPIYNKCGMQSFCGRCPPGGYIRNGCTCALKLGGADLIAKDVYYRGTGSYPVCNDTTYEVSGGLCFKICPKGLVGSGPICTIPCTGNYTTDCGPVCGDENFICRTQLLAMTATVSSMTGKCSEALNSSSAQGNLLSSQNMACIRSVMNIGSNLTLDGMCGGWSGIANVLVSTVGSITNPPKNLSGLLPPTP